MRQLNTSIRLSFFILIILAGCIILPVNSFGSSAKQKYLTADTCYKKLRHSSVKQKKATEWLYCISRYEIIYRLHPDSSWAPAGMYKASQLYLNLSKLSGKESHKIQARDLLTRLRNKYPKSAYSGRAKSLLSSIKTTPVIPHKKIKHLYSKKRLTQDEALIKEYRQKEKNNSNSHKKPSSPPSR